MNPVQVMDDNGIDFVYESSLRGKFITVCFNGTRYDSTAEEIGLYERIKDNAREELKKAGLYPYELAAHQ